MHMQQGAVPRRIAAVRSSSTAHAAGCCALPRRCCERFLPPLVALMESAEIGFLRRQRPHGNRLYHLCAGSCCLR